MNKLKYKDVNKFINDFIKERPLCNVRKLLKRKWDNYKYYPYEEIKVIKRPVDIKLKLKKGGYIIIKGIKIEKK